MEKLSEYLNSNFRNTRAILISCNIGHVLHMCFPLLFVILYFLTFPILYAAPSLLIVIQFNSASQSYLNLCNPMDCSTPGFPVHHQFQFTSLAPYILCWPISIYCLWPHILCCPISIHHSVQFSHSVVSESLWPHELQHARPPCPSSIPGVYPNSCPLRWWCHPINPSSVVPFSSCPQSFPASGSFQMSQLFALSGQGIGVTASTSVLPMNTQDWSPLGWTDWISLQSKELSRVFSDTTVQKHQFFCVQLSLYSNSHIHTWLLEKSWPWLDGPLLTK